MTGDDGDQSAEEMPLALTARTGGFGWAAWVLFVVVLLGAVAEFLIPPIPLSGFMLIPVLASAVLGRPVLTAALCFTSLALSIPIQLLLDYDRTLVTVRSVLIAASGIVAVGLAANLSRNQRARAAAQARLAEKEAQNRALADRLSAEMASAAQYMTSILPGDLHGEVEVTSRYLPALDFGGDSFHYRWLDGDHLKVYLLDVSGHGIRPALLSASLHNLMRSNSLPMFVLLEPAQVLDRLNQLFPMEDQGDTYFTIFYAVYQPSTRTLRYASAGHPPALLLTRDDNGVAVTPLSMPSIPIGAFGDTSYTSRTCTIPAGAQLLIYSDGAYELTDATDSKCLMANGDFINLCSALAARPDWSLDTLVNELKALSPRGEFDDDCALVLLTFR